jgi:hypothetical protein
MSRLQQGSLLKLKRKSGPDVWVFRWYEETGGIRTYRKRTLGTVARYPHLRDAERAADALRNTINSEFTVPETIAELVTHYRKHELTEEKKGYATIEANTLYLANHIVPKWGSEYLQGVRTVDVELWLHTLKCAPGTLLKAIPLIEGQQKQIETLTKENSDLVKRMEHLEGQPLPAKGHVRAVSKTQDGGATGETEDEYKARMAKMTPGQKSRELMKLAMSNPMDLGAC